MSIGPERIGQIQRVGSKYCLDKLGTLRSNRQIGIHSCHGNGLTQGFSYQKNQQIMFHPSHCLSLAKKENVTPLPPNPSPKLLTNPDLLTPDMNTTNHVVLLPCNSFDGEKWLYNEEVGICKIISRNLQKKS